MRLLPLVLLSLACGGQSAGRFAGTVQGTSLDVKDAVLLSNAEVWLSSSDKLCENLKANTYPKAGRIVKLVPHPVATGDFVVDASASAAKDHSIFMQFLKLDDACNNTLAFGTSVGTKGKVTVAHYDASKSIDGTFDMTFGDADAVTGSFNALYCDAPTTYPSPECK